MTEIYQVNLTREHLAAMPVAERRLLLLLGHATNEVNVFQKLILMAGQATPELKFVDHVQAGQVFILMRTLIGKLHEAWELFRVRFQSDPSIANRYGSKLNAEATAALVDLNKHFGKRSPLTLIRNGFSFHYKDEQDLVEESFQRIPADEEWNIYLSNKQGNCFYYASELVIAGAVIKLCNYIRDETQLYPAEEARNFGNLCDLLIKVSGDIQTLFGHCIAEIVSENFPHLQAPEPINITNAPALADMHIPFFTEDTEFKS